ncbi:MAG: hypothetical protein M1821_008397 [Bathelium mastoideum]|nr:MAG: hypothetical protein M1821_008397 [Bathelium mastoideum]
MTENAPPSTANATSTNAADSSTRGMPHYEKLRSNLRDTLARKRALDTKVVRLPQTFPKSQSTLPAPRLAAHPITLTHTSRAQPQAHLEDLILAHETAYLDETSAAGNIVRGFDNYIKAASTSTSAGTSLGASTGPGGSLSSSALGGSSASQQALGSLGAGTSTRRRAQIGDADRIFSRSSAAFTNADPSAASPPGSSSGGGVVGGGGGVGGGDGGGGGARGVSEGKETGSAGVRTPRSGGGHASTPGAVGRGGTPKSEVGKGGSRSKDKKKGSAPAGGAVEKNGEKEEEEEGRPAKRGKISYGRD